jgi:hypothetical protein
MNRDRHDLVSSHLDHAYRYPGRPEASRTVHASNRRGSCKRVPGALSGSALSGGAPGNDLPFGNDPIIAAEVIGESHGTGLSVVWTALCGHPRSAQIR